MTTEGKAHHTAPSFIEGETLFTIPIGPRELILTRDEKRRRCISIYVKFVSDDGDNFKYVARARTDEVRKVAEALQTAAEDVDRRYAAIALAVRQSKIDAPVQKRGWRGDRISRQRVSYLQGG